MPKNNLLDSRPFIKTAVLKSNYYEVSRKNQTTGKMYVVKVDKDLYISWIRSGKCRSIIDSGNFSKEQLAFLVKNQLKDEIRN